MQAVMTMDVPSSVGYFYPRLIPIHDLKANQDPVEVPAPIRCTIEKISEQGVYILGNSPVVLLKELSNIKISFICRKWNTHVPLDWIWCKF